MQQRLTNDFKFTLLVAFYICASNYVRYSYEKTAKIRNSKRTSLKMDVTANVLYVTANERDSYWTYPQIDATANGC